MKLLLISDHENSFLWDYYVPGRLDGIDLILSCGDLKPEYLSFLVTMGRAPVLYVCGNHDGRYEKTPPEGCDCIEDKLVTIKGLRILGMGGCPVYNRGPHQYTERQMERRLRKDFEKIYSDFAESRKTTELLVGDELKELRFIGETNIKSLVKLAMINDNKQYGMMLIASNEENFFEKGISYYETCLVEYNVSVKSTKLYLQTQDMARKDGLTQIYNRVYFGQLFAAAAEEATKKQQPLSVALFDIDKFKNINDTYGHLAGDKVIKMVASIDDKFARAHGGFACRYGGEEFLLVLPGYDETQALPILEEMHKEIQTTIVQYDDKEIPVNVCIGLSAYPTICRDTNILVNRADKSMYYGKKHGRGRLVVDNPAVDDMQS